MAGMLPGVECARRRRVHQAGSGADPLSGSRRSSFCLYASGHESHISSNSKQQRGIHYKSPYTSQSGDIGDTAREARGRLDEKLRAKNASETMRRNSMGSLWAGTAGKHEEQPAAIFASLHREVLCSQKNKRKSLVSWIKSGWKVSEQVECVVCLDEFRSGEVLVHLPCGHRFHCRCVLPWLQSCSRCPCCRTEIPSAAG